MKLSIARSVSMCLLAACAILAAAKAAEPVYNPSAEVRMAAVITGVRQVPEGSPMAGVHLTMQSKTGSVDVYLGPPAFLKIFRTEFPAGTRIEVVGARAGEVILAREVTIGATSITLRDETGAPVWEHWGVSADRAVTGG